MNDLNWLLLIIHLLIIDGHLLLIMLLIHGTICQVRQLVLPGKLWPYWNYLWIYSWLNENIMILLIISIDYYFWHLMKILFNENIIGRYWRCLSCAWNYLMKNIIHMFYDFIIIFTIIFFYFYFLKWQDFIIVIGSVGVGTVVPAVQSKVPPHLHAEFPLRRFCSLRFQPQVMCKIPIIGRSW